jgi:hypothetical protein
MGEDRFESSSNQTLEIGFGHHGKNDNHWFQSTSNLLTIEKSIFQSSSIKQWMKKMRFNSRNLKPPQRQERHMYVCMYVCM